MVFDRKQLAKDIMATISRLTDGKEFLGHDGRKYWIVSREGKPASKSFMDVVVRNNGADTTVASYGASDQDFPTMSAPVNAIRTSSVVQTGDGTAR